MMKAVVYIYALFQALGDSKAKRKFPQTGGKYMTLTAVLIIVLILMLIGAFPAWPHSREWGTAPSGILGTVVLILLILWLMGKI